jgi:hypothetical protein
MELSKKVGYIKGLMAGLKVDNSTPEGQILSAMSDLLEEMAEEIEINAEIIDNITAYIDEVEDQCDCLDDIYAEELDEDPFACGDEDCDCCCGDLAESEEAEVSEDLEEPEEPEEPEESEEESAEIPEEPVIGQKAVDTDESVIPVIESEEEPEPAADNVLGSIPFTAPEAPLLYECSCPICSTTFGITQEELDRGSANCPGCGELLEFE